MKFIPLGLIALITAIWIMAIAIISVQNVFIPDATGAETLVSLKFLGLSSISLPFGIILALSAAAGLIVTALLVPIGQYLWAVREPSRFRPRSDRPRYSGQNIGQDIGQTDTR